MEPASHHRDTLYTFIHPISQTKMAGTKRSSPGAEAAKEVEVELSEEQVKVLDDFSKELKRAELILGIFPFRPISYDVC